MAANSTTVMPPKNRPAPLWLILAAGALFVILWAFLFRTRTLTDQGVNHPGVGQLLPMLELQPLTGATEVVSLNQLHGKVVLVNYWGTWCPPCVLEFPHMVEMWDKYRGNPDFVFLSVSSTFESHEDVPKVREETEAFLRARGTNLPTYIDAEGSSRQILTTVISGEQGFAYPTTVLLDQTGIIRAVWVGYIPGYENQMEETISKLLSKERETKNDK